MELKSWEALDKSAKVEWNYLSQHRADEVAQRLEQITTQVLATAIPARCLTGIHTVHGPEGGAA